jgi:hypothetical protein
VSKNRGLLIGVVLLGAWYALLLGACESPSPTEPAQVIGEDTTRRNVTTLDVTVDDAVLHCLTYDRGITCDWDQWHRDQRGDT